MEFTTILIISAIVMVGYVIMTYNAFISLIEAVRNNQKQIDIQLDRRFKVFESLINVVKNYMDYEKSTLREVTELRSKAQAAKAQGDEKSRINYEDKISRLVDGISFVFEQYPDLKANQNALQLQEEIVNTENKLSYAKQAVNDSIETYNARKKSFPANIVVSMFGKTLNVNFEYWQISKDAIEKHENYTVQL